MLDVFYTYPWWTLFFISFIPFLEFKVAVPFGIWLLGVSKALEVILFVVILNLFAAGLLFLLAEYWTVIGSKIMGKRFFRWEQKIDERAQQYVRKYGIFSLAFLLAIPFPNSGIYAGSALSKVLGYKFKDYLKGCALGIVIYCCSVGLLSIIFITVTA